MDGRIDRSKNTPQHKPKRQVMSSSCTQKQAGVCLEDDRKDYNAFMVLLHLRGFLTGFLGQ